MMNNRQVLAAVTLGFGFILLSMITTCYGNLQVGFYDGKCGHKDVETIIRRVVTRRYSRDRTIAAALLRLQFHDCFVKGCDASILVDGPSSEKAAGPNQSVRGYDIIDDVKKAVERACPGLVSCADIIAIATRDAVALSTPGLFKRRYAVETGRRDGLVSDANNVVDIPGPSISVSNSIALFKRKGLTTDEMVLLLGGHTVGITHCAFINNRLYNFRNTKRADPSMDPQLVQTLRRRCPQNSNANNEIALDQNQFSSFTVDKSFYRQIKANRGVLLIDQAIALDNSTSSKVTSLANGFNFNAEFGAAMVKMGAIEVLTGKQGQIRKNCRVVNPIS